MNSWDIIALVFLAAALFITRRVWKHHRACPRCGNLDVNSSWSSGLWGCPCGQQWRRDGQGRHQESLRRQDNWIRILTSAIILVTAAWVACMVSGLTAAGKGLFVAATLFLLVPLWSVKTPPLKKNRREK